MECGGGAWQGRLKKYYPKRSAGVEIFFKPFIYPCKHVFVEQRERLTNTFLPALFFAEQSINVFTADNNVRSGSEFCERSLQHTSQPKTCLRERKLIARKRPKEDAQRLLGCVSEPTYR
jgi:hypothetical protein